ncbi:MAG: DUF86 domain-containing protein [Nitrospiraceae bacterium]|nr:DUF86 domain-containing protein [Nitrospiraceae bacterium]
MVDKTVLQRKISDLDTYFGQIGQYADITLESYSADWKTQRIVERTLQMMIETCADIANHVISDGRMRPPTSYADTFKILQENKIVDAELSATMMKMAKFRNVVVHQYEGVDAGIVIAILKKHLSDFNAFRNTIIAYLGKS